MNEYIRKEGVNFNYPSPSGEFISEVYPSIHESTALEIGMTAITASMDTNSANKEGFQNPNYTPALDAWFDSLDS